MILMKMMIYICNQDNQNSTNTNNNSDEYNDFKI